MRYLRMMSVDRPRIPPPSVTNVRKHPTLLSAHGEHKPRDRSLNGPASSSDVPGADMFTIFSEMIELVVS